MIHAPVAAARNIKSAVAVPDRLKGNF